MDATAEEYFDHSAGQRINTSAVVSRALKDQYPDLALVTVAVANCNLLDYATATGEASFQPISNDDEKNRLILTQYATPTNRTDKGVLEEVPLFAKYEYRWADHCFVLYLIEGRDGSSSFPAVRQAHILTSNREKAEALVFAAGKWTNELHDEIWVYDSGYWQKSAELFASIQSASWDNVILNPKRKKTIIDDHLSFFQSREQYKKFQVPWKRGIIYYGPPGNGKTISIKAMMHMLYSLKEPIPTLYVRSLVSGLGPEYAVKQIFEKARRTAPCYLIFEDLDSIVTDRVRSYFLNEVDGLKANDGIFMLGSTNHLDQLDPGIAKRPSRFDRKYLFDDPNKEERVAYCHFWQRKLHDNPEIAFPDVLCDAIAGITDKFSFAFIQEAFVATLLAIARSKPKREKAEDEPMVDFEEDEEEKDDWIGVSVSDDLDKYVLWREIKKQVKVLREEIKSDNCHLDSNQHT